MKLFIGLGNPGAKYEKNRHNVGFLYLDHVVNATAQKESIAAPEFVTDSYLQADVAQIRTKKEDYIFLKPRTYMNKSGESVRKAVKKYNPDGTIVSPLDIVVVHDDLDIPFGKCKVQLQGPKLHNGVESIQNHLKTTDFLRIRIGVDNRNPGNRVPGETYVLQNFTEEEYASLADIFMQVAKRFEAYLQSNSN